MQQINKNTKIYCSFSQNAGNKGCEFFNSAFLKHNIDAIYKSFSINCIDEALKSAKCLKFSGCAISMPFKKIAFNLVDKKDESAIDCQSINTILFNYNRSELIGYNTDYYATEKLIIQFIDKHSKLYVLGNGGLAMSVIAKAQKMKFEVVKITRNNWNDIITLRNSLIFNCTPVKSITLDASNDFIDCTIGTYTGDLFHKYQAEKQFEIYTGIK